MTAFLNARDPFFLRPAPIAPPTSRNVAHHHRLQVRPVFWLKLNVSADVLERLHEPWEVTFLDHLRRRNAFYQARLIARRVSASSGFSSGVRSYSSSFTGQVHDGEAQALSLMPAPRPSLLLDVNGSPPYIEPAYWPGRDHSDERKAWLFVRYGAPQKWRSHGCPSSLGLGR